MGTFIILNYTTIWLMFFLKKLMHKIDTHLSTNKEDEAAVL